VSDHQAKEYSSAWLYKLIITSLRHQTQTRFCNFLTVSLFFLCLRKSSVVASNTFWCPAFCLFLGESGLEYIYMCGCVMPRTVLEVKHCLAWSLLWLVEYFARMIVVEDGASCKPFNKIRKRKIVSRMKGWKNIPIK